MFKFDFLEEDQVVNNAQSNNNASASSTKEIKHVPAAEIFLDELKDQIEPQLKFFSKETIKFPDHNFSIERLLEVLEEDNESEASSDCSLDDHSEQTEKTNNNNTADPLTNQSQKSGATHNRQPISTQIRTPLGKNSEFVNLDHILESSDLVPSVYEGGFKLWECALDLVQYVVSEQCKLNFSNCTVLELGCGHGLPALVTSFLGASSVHFQDYNAEVLRRITIPNCILNKQIDKTRFFCGDWGDLKQLIPAESYDFVLSCDTLYNTEAHEKFLEMLAHALKPRGVAVLAQKRFYFGVGGGTREFVERAEQRGLVVSMMKTMENGSSNIREIFLVQK